MRRLELLRYALNQAKFDCDGHLASFSLPISAVEEMGVLPEDNEGIIDHLAVRGRRGRRGVFRGTRRRHDPR